MKETDDASWSLLFMIIFYLLCHSRINIRDNDSMFFFLAAQYEIISDDETVDSKECINNVRY